MTPDRPAAESRDLRRELERVARVADMMCSAHSALRDRYVRRALVLDLAILMPSAWLVALAFVEPRLNVSLTPFGLAPQVWVGLLSVVVFGFSVLQLRVDWKGRADAHARALDGYAEVKRDARFMLASGSEITERACRPVFARYGSAGATPVPEREFLAQKRRHVLKVAVSKHLDRCPAASPAVTKIRFWIRDNLFGSLHNEP